jgi:HSP20 family protein
MAATIRFPATEGKLDSVAISLYMRCRLNHLARRLAIMGRWRIQRFDPFRELTDMQAEINRAFDAHFGVRLRTPVPERAWAPPLDVYETRDDLVVAVELPGVREKDIQLSMTGDVLSLRGQRGTAVEAREENYHRIERWSGAFERHIQLPVPVQADKIRASYRDGVLEVRLPKLEEVKPREIKIDVG